MKITDFTFTHHALRRILDMGIDLDELRQCLERPLVTVAASPPDRPSRQGDTVYRSTRIAAVVTADNAVKTVVWSNPRDWQADVQRGGDYDRHFNPEEWQPSHPQASHPQAQGS